MKTKALIAVMCLLFAACGSGSHIYPDGSVDAGYDAGGDPGGDEAPELRAVDDSYEAHEDTRFSVPRSLGVLSNDTSGTGGALAAELVSNVSNGTLGLDPDGAFIYIPDPGYAGPDQFTYRADDSGTKSNTATVTITVLEGNEPPVALPEDYQVNEDEVLTVDAQNGVLSNDTDPDGDQLFAALVSSTQYGDLDLHQDGSFVYTPSLNYAGSDRFIYQAGDTQARSEQITVSIEVLPLNDPPAAFDDGYYAEPDVLLTIDSSFSVLRNDQDPDSEPLTAVLITDVSNGTLQLDPTGSFTYQPDAGFSGQDSFTYQAQDAALLSSSAEVTLWVVPELQMDWVVAAGGPSGDSAQAAAAFIDGSSVITGTFYETCTFGSGETNETTLTAGGTMANFFIARYNPDGTLAWAKSATSEGMDDTGLGALALSDNSALVVGQYMRDATFGAGETNETILHSPGSRAIFLARYNSDGTLAWAVSAGSTSAWEKANGVVEMSDGSFAITGRHGDQAVFGAGEVNETTLSSEGHGDIFIARYNPDGTLLWAKGAGGTRSEDEGTGITRLTDDSLVITGSFGYGAVFGAGEPNETELMPAGSVGDGDVFIARYAPDGSLIWAKRGGSESLWDHGMGLAPLPDDSFIATGWHGPGSTFNEVSLGSAGRNDIFIIRYDKDGEILWSHRAGGSSFGDEGRAVTILTDGTILVAGAFRETATFGPDQPNEVSLTVSGENDIFFARYAQDGTFIGVHQAGGPGQDYAHGTTSISAGSVLITGSFYETSVFAPGEPNQTELTSADLSDVFLMRYSP